MILTAQSSIKDMNTIIDFLNQTNIHNENDLEAISQIAETLTLRIESGDEHLVPLVDFLLEKIESYEDKVLEQLIDASIDEVEIVKALIDFNELSITSLSKQIGMQRTVLSEILNRKKERRFTRDQLEALAKYFNVKISVFFQ